ncbi:MAG: glycosyltransferase family 4 protein [Sulfurovum sp.]|nr:glycosyltransferase family 4 protein [Sulfurovum sp.]
MNIWIFNHHALTPDMSGGTRHYDFAKELTKRGHSVTIVASSFHYSKYEEMKEYDDKEFLQEQIDGVDFVWIKTPAYFGNGVARVRNMLSYTYKVLKIIPKLKLKKPDIIIGSSVHLFAVYGAYKLSKKYATPFVMEVRDIWPQTLIDMGISKWHPFIIMLGWLEKYLYKKADKIISNLPYAYEHIEKFVSKNKFVWISNGVDLDNIPYVEKEKTDIFVISYTGAIGVANNLALLVGAAINLKDKKDILFRIVGDGAEKAKLKKIVKSKQLKNISIEDSVSKGEVSGILKSSDALYFNLKDSPVFNYGISSNKLFDYMASGRVIIFSSKARNNPIRDANAGYTIDTGDIEQLEKAILGIYALKQDERNKIGRKIRRYTEENYDIDILVDKLESILKHEVLLWKD